MSLHTRACDRCARLKGQCTRDEPCGRCSRLNLSCTYNRPVGRRGRPPASAARSLPATSPAISPVTAGPGRTRRRRRRRSPDDETTSVDSGSVVASATAAVERDIESAPVASSITQVISELALGDDDMDLRIDCFNTALGDLPLQVGILAAFRAHHQQLLAESSNIALSAHGRAQELEFLRSRVTMCTLMLCASYLDPLRSCPDSFTEDCRMLALSEIPILPCGDRTRDINTGDIYCLCVLSHLYYFQPDLTVTAFHWADLSEALGRRVTPSSSSSTEYEMERHRRVMALVAINTEIKALLANDMAVVDSFESHTWPNHDHGERGPSMDTEKVPKMPDNVWHHHTFSSSSPLALSSESNSFQHPSEGFFPLFLPLATCLKTLRHHQYHQSSSSSGDALSEMLDDYFISFPTKLMDIASVQFTWQLEAMIWFHGIYVAGSCGSLDMISIMLGLTIFRDEDLASSLSAAAMDHALLLGDVLPFLLELNKKTGSDNSSIRHLSPMTIFFVCVSSAVLVYTTRIVLLQQASSIPVALLRSARAHESVLSAIVLADDSNNNNNNNDPACTHPLVTTILKILSATLRATSYGLVHPVEDLRRDMHGMRRFRWTSSTGSGGKGLMGLDDIEAERLLEDAWSRADKLWEESNSSSSNKVLLPAGDELQRLFSPGQRINAPGTFDLSISQSVAMQQPLCLSPRQNQEYRLLLRVCQHSLTAIDGYGCPILSHGFPLSASFPSLLDAMLAIARQVQQQSECGGGGAAAASRQSVEKGEAGGTDAYQAALSEIRKGLSQYGNEAAETRSETFMIAAIASAAILLVLSFSSTMGDWQDHAKQVVALIDSCQHFFITKTTTTAAATAMEQQQSSKKLELFLLMCVAHSDISSFSLGRTTPSTNAWLRWGIAERTATTNHHQITSDTSSELSDFEITTGYPASLVSLIARLSARIDDDEKKAKETTTTTTTTTSSSPSIDLSPLNLAPNPSHSPLSSLSSELETYSPPLLPPNMPPSTKLAVSTARRVMTRAARIFHCRGRGFHSDLTLPLLLPISLSSNPLAAAANKTNNNNNNVEELVEDILVSIAYLLDSFQNQNQNHNQNKGKGKFPPVANSMAWAVAVAGGECGKRELRHLQGLVVKEIIRGMVGLFYMDHLDELRKVLEEVWRRVEGFCESEYRGEREGGGISLESVAREMGVCIPLM